MYWQVSAKASDGACKSIASGFVKIIVKIERITPIMEKSKIALPIAFPASSGFCSPIFCPTKTVTPIVKPTTRFVNTCKSILPVETPDTSPVEANCPTIKRSAPPYNACKNIAANTGIAKRNKPGKTFPCISEFSFVILFFPKNKIAINKNSCPLKKTDSHILTLIFQIILMSGDGQNNLLFLLQLHR